MALDHRLISQFAKLITSETKQSSESTVYGTVKTDANGNKYVQLDGSDQLTPLSDENKPSVDTTTAKANDGDRVSVLIKNHTATVTGNISSPAASDGDIETAITKFDIAVGDQIQANKAYFKDLTADKADIGSLAAAIISVAELIAKDATIEELISAKITVDDLIAKKIDTDIVIADNAIVGDLKANNADILSLIADKATIEELIATKVTINDLIAEKLDVTWANIDFGNIDLAVIGKLFTTSGIIKDLTTETGTITGELVGVTIKGDLIEGNTIVADKLVVKGSDGLYYKINAGIEGITDEQLSSEEFQNGIHGDAIITKSITADKLKVTDLFAFGATIGGFKIKGPSEDAPGAIHTLDKTSVDSSLSGIYLDDEGQAAFGDSNNFLKFYKDENGDYKLSVSAERIRFGIGKDFILDDNGMTVEGTNTDSNNVIKTNISNNGMTVYSNNDDVLKANDKGVVAKDLHAKTYLIVGGNSRFENYGNNRTGCFWIGGSK